MIRDLPAASGTRRAAYCDHREDNAWCGRSSESVRIGSGIRLRDVLARTGWGVRPGRARTLHYCPEHHRPEKEG